MPVEIADWRQGKQTRRGRPTPTEPFPVTVVMPHEAQRFFNARDEAELRRHLRGLRDLGLLVTEPDRLTQYVRPPGHARFRAYVVRGREADVPRLKARPQGRMRVMRW